jgi:hypothetical protein
MTETAHGQFTKAQQHGPGEGSAISPPDGWIFAFAVQGPDMADD